LRLHEIAHSRSGDKGNTADITVIAYQARDYERLRDRVTAERVKAHLVDVVQGQVERYELPHLAALKFVLRDALSGGVTRSLSLDPHGKSIASCLLELELPEDDRSRPAA
jgi:competence protein ComGC